MSLWSQAARDPASKSGACAGALRRASAALSAVAKSYAALARMSFYADDTTLRLLYMYPLELKLKLLHSITFK